MNLRNHINKSGKLMNGHQNGLVEFDSCRIVWSRRSVSNIWIPIWAQRWFESRSELKDDGSSNSFLPLLIQRHRGVTLLAVGASSYSCLFQLGIKPNHKSIYCKGKTLSLLCDITFNAWPMFFLERSLFWYRLIGAIPPRGITGLRIKGECVSTKWERRDKKVQHQCMSDFTSTNIWGIFTVKDTLS